MTGLIVGLLIGAIIVFAITKIKGEKSPPPAEGGTSGGISNHQPK